MKIWLLIFGLAFPCYASKDRADLQCALQVAMGRLAGTTTDKDTKLPWEFRLTDDETVALQELYTNVKTAMDSTLDENSVSQYAQIASDIELLFIASFHRLVYSPELSGWVKALRMPPEEILSIASIGILYGMERWSPEKGSFSTYVVYCLRTPLLAARAEQQGIIRPEAARLGKLSRAAERLFLALQRKPTDEEWEAESGLSHKEFIDTCELAKRLAYEASGENGRPPIESTIPDHRESDPVTNTEAANLREKIDRVLTSLAYREREIVKLRYGLGDGYAYTLEETARIFKVSRERMRAIQARTKSVHAPPRSEQLRRFLDRLAQLPLEENPGLSPRIEE